jgi:Na+/H+ antiporter NhaC
MMVPSILILTLAWTLSGMTNLLGASEFVSGLVSGSASSMKAFLPVIIFLIGFGLSFATGTSWGTFGILIPIVVGVFPEGEMMIISIAACLSGAVCGDHCSPISDTTILASAGAQCDHVAHVSTQLPYVLLVTPVACISFILAGLTKNVWISLGVGLAVLLVVLTVIKKKVYTRE